MTWAMPDDFRADYRRAVHDAVRGKGFTLNGRPMAFHVWSSTPEARVIPLADAIEPIMETIIGRVERGRLFRFTDYQRNIVRLVLGIALRSHGYCESGDSPGVNRASLDLCISIENMMSELWRLEAGGKPRE